VSPHCGWAKKLTATLEDREGLLTVSEAAEYLNVSKVTIRRWTNNGTLACVRVGVRKERRFVESELRKLISGPGVDVDHATTTKAVGGMHCCVVCDEPEHEWEAIGDAIVDHLSGRSQVVFIGDAERMDRLGSELTRRGMDPESLAASGALRRLSIEASYLLSGDFSADRAIAFAESTILESYATGFDRLLFIGCVDWALTGQASQQAFLIKEVMAYEKGLNSILEKYPTTTILCPYVLSQVDSKTIVDAFWVHPKLLYQSQFKAGLYTGS